MRETVNLSPTPVGESCAQLGDADYYVRARKECGAFINQLIREFGPPPEGAGLKITQNPHDFGTYLDVEAWYREGEEAAAEWAYRLEANLPERWDEAALLELSQ